MKLDKKDKRILYELDKNARQPLSRIAKKVNLSRESILYRLRKYQKEGIIRNFLTVMNSSKIGISYHKVYVKLHNIAEEEEKEFISYLCSHKNIAWVASCDGKYSLIFGPGARDLVELNSVIQDIMNKYWRFVMHYDVASIVGAHHFYRDYLIGEKGTTERLIAWGGEQESAKLDAKNIEILDLLAKDARLSAVDVAKKVGLSADAVIQRIKQLEKQGVIEHYMIWPDVNKLTGIFYKVLVSLHDLNRQKEKQLISYCLQQPNIVYAVSTFGPWQLELDIEVESIEQFRSIMRDFLSQFAGIVSDYSPLNIYDEYKFRFFDKRMLEK
ncbi:MAG: Lrp/AsnC family transcriptional regulator [Nanoarchaeota archaeon]|nr:Lrp/AsnC family transcriptional regulator [Nanoarchaeota archaeon]